MFSNPRTLSRLPIIVNNNPVLEVVQTHNHNAPMKSIDIPVNGLIAQLILKAGVFGVFVLGKIIGKTYLQTIICKRDDE